MGIDYTQEHAAACVACLPLDSALYARMNPDFRYMLKNVPVNSILNALKRPNDPSELEFGSMPIDELDAFLKSKEVS